VSEDPYTNPNTFHRTLAEPLAEPGRAHDVHEQDRDGLADLRHASSLGSASREVNPPVRARMMMSGDGAPGGWRRGSHSGFREGDSRRSDRRPDRAKPQVTRVIGVFDPYRCSFELHTVVVDSGESPLEDDEFQE
jgi:hypothetical protein